MSKQGASPHRTFTPLQQRLEVAHNTGKVAIPVELQQLGLKKEEDYAKFLIMLSFEIYKLQSTAVGEMIALSAKTKLPLDMGAYFVRSSDHFKIILGAQQRFYQIQNDTPEPWHPIEALLERIPQPSLYHLAIDIHKDKLKNLAPNQSMDLSHLQVIRTEDENYIALLIQDATFTRIDLLSARKDIWQAKNNLWMNASTQRFMARIQKLQTTLATSGLPKALTGLITEIDATIKYVLNDIGFKQACMTGQSFRIPKASSHLPYTLNMIKEEKGEWHLMLETKNTCLGQGRFGTITPCFRLDGENGIEYWVNKTLYAEKIAMADFETFIAADLKDANRMHTTLLGAPFYSSKKLQYKKSLYLKRALGDLEQILQNPHIILTQADKERIIETLLQDIALMHSQDKVHQDIKAQNILIYQDEKGYYAVIADFNCVYDCRTPKYNGVAYTPPGYASPEIMLAHEDGTTPQHKPIWQDLQVREQAYGYHILLQNDLRDPHSTEAKAYRKPHPANDMWAIGTVIFALLYGCLPDPRNPIHHQYITQNPLLKGLLDPDRQKRLTAPQAIQRYAIEKVYDWAKNLVCMQEVLDTKNENVSQIFEKALAPTRHALNAYQIFKKVRATSQSLPEPVSHKPSLQIGGP